jgi:uncharacterized metal-binding protein YceD (DUF177 family)
MSRPEFSRPVPIDSIGPAPSETCVEAAEHEREALAGRLGLPALTSLKAAFALHREDSGPVVLAHAVLDASVVQTCAVSLDEFEARITEDFTVRFVPAGSETDTLDPDAPDEIPYQGGAIDLGEATAEQLALALDPFARKPDAVFESETEPAVKPFTALQSLRRAH